MAGAVFAEIGMSLFVAGVPGREILIDELRKKTYTFTFTRGLIRSACAKGKCWFAKDRESKSAPRKSRKMMCIYVRTYEYMCFNV